MKDEMIDCRAAEMADHAIKQQADIQQFFMDNLWSLENITNIIALHQHTPAKMGCLIRQQLESDMMEEFQSEVRDELGI